MSETNQRGDFDAVIQKIADYVLTTEINSELAYQTAYHALLDSIGCGVLALSYPQCTKLLGPIVPGAQLKDGVPIMGTHFRLDPVQAAFNIGALIRWLDYNDTWLAAEWGHPSDNLAGILAVSYYLAKFQQKTLTIADVLTAMIKAYEIQGILALENSFNRVGLDHVVLVKVATTAVVAQLLGATREQLCNAISLAWVDGQSLRTYRHAPNTGSRKSWAAGDAGSRAVWLALMALRGEMGYPSVLSAPQWGFCDIYGFKQGLLLGRDFDSYVMENILFKISYPAEFHAQTAAEAAIILHPQIKDRLTDIEKITIRTQESAVRIIDKKGPLHNPADRDHCIQYIAAIGLIFGELTAEHYEDNVAQDPRIDAMRDLMQVSEEQRFSKDYLDADKRSIANAIQVYFKDGSQTEEVIVEYPIGHRQRREQGIPLLFEKFRNNLSSHYTEEKAEQIYVVGQDYENFQHLSVLDFMDLLS